MIFFFFQTDEVRITNIMMNVISNRSENGNPDQLCLRAVQLCLIYEGTGNARVTAEGIETIRQQQEFIEFNPEFYNIHQIEYLTVSLENLPVLKCKVQKNALSSNNIPLNNVPANITPTHEVLLGNLFARITLNDDVAPSDHFYFYIFLFREESRYPMFIFQSNGPNSYFPQYEIRDEDNDDENENRQPNNTNIANNSQNGHV